MRNIDWIRLFSDLIWSIMCFAVDLAPIVLNLYFMYWCSIKHEAYIASHNTWYSKYIEYQEAGFLLFAIIFVLYGAFFDIVGVKSPTKWFFNKISLLIEREISKYEEI